MSGQVMSGQVRSGQVKSSQVKRSWKSFRSRPLVIFCTLLYFMNCQYFLDTWQIRHLSVTFWLLLFLWGSASETSGLVHLEPSKIAMKITRDKWFIGHWKYKWTRPEVSEADPQPELTWPDLSWPVLNWPQLTWPDRIWPNLTLHYLIPYQKCLQKFSERYLIQNWRYPYICLFSVRKEANKKADEHAEN